VAYWKIKPESVGSGQSQRYIHVVEAARSGLLGFIEEIGLRGLKTLE
jgi:hypothetical protein